MQVIRAINEYFLHDADEQLDFSEYAWFYGSYSAAAIMVIVVAFSI